MAQIDLKNAVMSINDNGSNTIEITIGEGNITYSEKRNMEYTLDRGILDEVREGDEVPMDVAFDFTWEYIMGTVGTAGVPTVEDALKQINAASGWASTDADACRPYAVDIEIFYDPPCTGNVEKIILADFRYEEFSHDLRAGTVSVTGRCNVKTATVTRGVQTT